jgi:hypothetical protein
MAISVAVIALACALRAAYLWGQSTRVRPEPAGFEPVVPELKQGWWRLAECEATARASKFNWLAAWWTAATAIFGFVDILIGLLPA